MANIIKLGNRPKHFKEIEVVVTLPDGTEGVIPITYKYKTKSEFGAWQDGCAASSAPPKVEDSSAPPKVEAPSWESIYRQAGERSADMLLEIVHAWGLDVPLSRESIIELEADCGAAVIPALFRAFGVACREGRLGN